MIPDLAGIALNRWGDGGGHPNYSEQQLGEIMAISVGLGALFDENIEAERRWMQTIRVSLGCRPITAILRGDTAPVLALVNKERGL